MSVLNHRQPGAPKTHGISRTGFTLLEVLLALAVIALVSTLLIGGTAQLLKNQAAQTPDDVFWKTVEEARKTALKTEHDIRLKFDPEKKRFLLFDSTAPAVQDPNNPLLFEEPPLKEFPLPSDMGTDLTIDFLSSTKGGPTNLIGGVLVESQPIKYVTFYPDGTCSPFRAQFTRPNGVHTLNIDPWTCAPVLKTDENKT